MTDRSNRRLKRYSHVAHRAEEPEEEEHGQYPTQQDRHPGIVGLPHEADLSRAEIGDECRIFDAVGNEWMRRAA